MIRRTYGSVKDQLARVTQNGMCASDPQLLARTNEAQERLLNKGLYAGTYGRYSICVYGGCITLPREFESIVGYNFGHIPGQVYNEWYEFMDNGPGIAPAGDWKRLIDRGYVPMFRDLPDQRYLKVYTDQTEDSSATILFRGSDTYNDRIRTLENNEYIDGERLNLQSSPATTTKTFRHVDAINKTVTKGWIRIYAVDPDTNAEACVAILAPDETLPMYRRYAIPGYENKDGTAVTVLAKRKFIPITSDDDDLIVTNLGALKMMAIAIEKEENNNLEEAAKYEAKALELLREELREVQGSAIGRPQVQMEMFAMGEIPNMA
jgi:hypothetical protein